MKTSKTLALVVMAIGMFIHTAKGETQLNVSKNNEQTFIGFEYSSNSLKGFFRGLTRPFHLWNKVPGSQKEILPFWTKPLRDGGSLCWLNPRCWKENPGLTAGTLTSEILVAVAVSTFTEKDSSSSSTTPQPQTSSAFSGSVGSVSISSSSSSSNEAYEESSTVGFVDIVSSVPPSEFRP